jgi:hypothetical protein
MESIRLFPEIVNSCEIDSDADRSRLACSPLRVSFRGDLLRFADKFVSGDDWIAKAWISSIDNILMLWFQLVEPRGP